MIRNWFQKKNEIVFLCDKKYLNAFNYYKPNYSGTFIPEWFKKLPTTIEVENSYGLKYDLPTARSCYGIKNTITNGIILPLWTDIIIEVFPNKTWKSQCSNNMTEITQHSKNQYIGLFEKCCVLKIESPWLMQSKKTTSLFLTQPLYHQGDVNNFFILPGIITFNKQPCFTNIFIGIPYKNEPQRIMIKSGFPIIQYINTTKEVINVKTKLIDSDEYHSYASVISFTNSFQKQLKMAERNE